MIKRNGMGFASFIGAKLDISLENRQKNKTFSSKVSNRVSRKEQVIYERERSSENESDENATP